MKTIDVSVKTDYLQGMSKVRPLMAVAELIWNAFDADADRVEVSIRENGLGGVESVIVRDDGEGLRYDLVDDAFGNLGGSWKRSRRTTTDGKRKLHGRRGRGRFTAFSVASRVVWKSRFKVGKDVEEFEITGNLENLGKFSVSEPQKVVGKPGIEVRLENLPRNAPSLLGKEARIGIAEQFAFYLMQYPDLELVYEGQRIDPEKVILRSETYDLDPTSVPAGAGKTSLSVVEWSFVSDRALFLCDADGFALRETEPGYVRAPGYHFSAYLKSDYLRKLELEGSIDLEGLNPGLNKLLEAAREKIREHFRNRISESAAGVVEEWKKQRIYPYADDPTTLLETTERQIFDVVAVSLNAYSSDFERSDEKAKKITLSLLKTAVMADAAAVQTILTSVLDLPEEKQKEFADLLTKTTLQAVISAAKVVTDRLDFLQGLSHLLFDPDAKHHVKERKNLQRLVAANTWIFGEGYQLCVDDESLNAALLRHCQLLGIDAEEGEVKRADGSRGILDLMLAKVVHLPSTALRHLVMEFKRPTVSIDEKAAAQIESYADAVARDPRFNKTETEWVFYAISNEISSAVERRINQAGRAPGILHQSPDHKICIWVRTWGEVIQECEARMRFYKEKLEYSATQSSGLAHLQSTYDKYLPKALSAKG